MSEVACHLLVQLPKIRRSLRRYHSSDDKCPKGTYGYCNAQALIDEVDYPIKAVIESYNFPHDDPRWPKACEACGRVFTDKDAWQVFVDTLYQRGSEILSLRDAQPGDMWDAWWMPDTYKHNPDKLCLVLKLPNGSDWMIDGGSTQQPKPGAWTRTGTPPKITASPSILASDYHGWLRNGVLVSV